MPYPTTKVIKDAVRADGYRGQAAAREAVRRMQAIVAAREAAQREETA